VHSNFTVYMRVERCGTATVYQERQVKEHARLESAEVVGEVGEDHFHDVMGDMAGRFVRGTCFWSSVVEEAPDTGFTSDAKWSPHESKRLSL